MGTRVVGRTADGEPLVVLCDVPSETEGRLVQGLLESHGVPSSVVGRESSGYGVGASPLHRLRVLVLAADHEAASLVLDAPWEEPDGHDLADV